MGFTYFIHINKTFHFISKKITRKELGSGEKLKESSHVIYMYKIYHGKMDHTFTSITLIDFSYCFRTSSHEFSYDFLYSHLWRSSMEIILTFPGCSLLLIENSLPLFSFTIFFPLFTFFPLPKPLSHFSFSQNI